VVNSLLFAAGVDWFYFIICMDYYGDSGKLIWWSLNSDPLRPKVVSIFLCYLKYLALDPDPITSPLCVEAGSGSK
jgi:hypothetical protein